MIAARHVWTLLAVLVLAARADAGLYFSGETFAELPSQWRGYLVDQRALRTIAAVPADGTPTPLRQDYLDRLARLDKLGKTRALTADELADLGALHIRLGDAAKAVEVLRPAQRAHPTHFRINANLGTAWQLRGDLAQAILCLEQAVQLAPGKYQKAEDYHLKLLRLRQRGPADSQALDHLFGVRFVDDKGGYTPGKLAAAEVKLLPTGAASIAQQLGLWLPADGRLLWLLAELANAHGDVKLAAAIFDGCVTEFGMTDPELRRRRQLTRAAADALEENPPAGKTEHEGHAGAMKPKSRRPLLGRLDLAELPPIRADSINAVPWALLAETSVTGDFKVTFPKYLTELNGKQVSLAGFMQPIGEGDLHSFMLIEYPVGCWFCEVPEVTGIALVEMAAGQNLTFSRSLVKVTGTLTLNSSDPERFLYTITKGKISGAD